MLVQGLLEGRGKEEGGKKEEEERERGERRGVCDNNQLLITHKQLSYI
jgi:hypothetical protein